MRLLPATGISVLMGVDEMIKNCAIKSTVLFTFLMFFGCASAAQPEEMKAPASGNQNLLGITVGPTSGVRGVRVMAIDPGSPCESVIKPGDAIYAITLIGEGDSRLGGARVNTDNFQAADKGRRGETGIKIREKR